jgi:hypothetical protein
MKLARLGTISINFDRVSTIRDLTPDPGGGPRLVRIEFEEGHTVDVTTHAQQLIDWVNAQATEPVPAPPAT